MFSLYAVILSVSEESRKNSETMIAGCKATRMTGRDSSPAAQNDRVEWLRMTEEKCSE